MVVDDPDERSDVTSEGDRRIKRVKSLDSERTDPGPKEEGIERRVVDEGTERRALGEEAERGPVDKTEQEPEGENEQEPGFDTNSESDKGSDPTLKTELLSPLWHPASRDWNICAGIMIVLVVCLGSVLVYLDVLKNFMLVGFFGFFILFLLFIAGYFLMQSKKLESFQAAYIGHRRDSEIFTASFESALLERDITPLEESPCVSGHTFGLLTDERTMKLPNGEIVEINSFHITAGFVLGLYILIRPHPLSKASESSALMLLDSMVQRQSPLSR